MATSITVNGKTVKKPGVYAITKSGVKYPPRNLPYGNICIIDSGIGAKFVGGAGVLGSLNRGTDSIYNVTTIQEYQGFTKGGILWDLGECLFRPSGANIAGVSKVSIIKAAETTNAEISLTFANGSVTFLTKDEGINANGVLLNSQLTRGYAVKLIESSLNPERYIVQFFHGDFKGIDPLNNIPYELPENEITSTLLFQSVECVSIQDLIDWCLKSNEFNSGFQLKPGYTATGNFTPEDLTNNLGLQLAVGGTENYTNAAFLEAVKSIKNLDNTFFLATEYGENSTSLNNERIFDYILNDSKYEKFLFVPGGFDKNEYSGATNTSEATAKYYNSDKVVCVHGGYKKSVRGGFLLKSQLHKAAMVLGRTCGLPPQTPITYKSLTQIAGEVHKLDEDEMNLALDRGILTTYYDDELNYHVILQGINTLQNNENLVNEDGTSFSIAVRRITAQLNKEIMINAKKVFFAKEDGPNRNTITEEDISAWLEGFLQTRTAGTLEDNLILRFGNINTVIQQDNYWVTYEFVPNFEVSKIVFTGVLLME